MRRLLVCSLLASCTAGVFSSHGYLWYFNDKLPVCNSYTWIKADPIDIQRICADSGHDYMIGCSFVQGRCIVFSMYNEETAKTVFLPGTDWSHRDHEVIGHIQNRWSHP